MVNSPGIRAIKMWLKNSELLFMGVTKSGNWTSLSPVPIAVDKECCQGQAPARLLDKRIPLERGGMLQNSGKLPCVSFDRIPKAETWNLSPGLGGSRKNGPYSRCSAWKFTNNTLVCSLRIRHD